MRYFLFIGIYLHITSLLILNSNLNSKFQFQTSTSNIKFKLQHQAWTSRFNSNSDMHVKFQLKISFWNFNYSNYHLEPQLQTLRSYFNFKLKLWASTSYLIAKSHFQHQTSHSIIKLECWINIKFKLEL